MPEKETSSENFDAESPKKENKTGTESNFIKDISQTDAIIGKNLVKDYEIGDFIVRAVDDVSLSIYTGEFIVIKGPSGAGKTSLLNLIGGLDSPTNGEIYSFGVKISDMEEETLTTWRLLNLGFVFQNYNLISTLTAEENVMFPLNLSGVIFKEQRKRAVELLTTMGLVDRREHLPFQLSAGEQQRVALARALANDPPMIIADEPTANLDKITSQLIRDLFKNLKNGVRTIIVATHDDYLIGLADRILSFDDGKIIKEEIVRNLEK
ncbi:MAG: ABC transporter ATP-binding protein [Promethearchaeota archaeon]